MRARVTIDALVRGIFQERQAARVENGGANHLSAPLSGTLRLVPLRSINQRSAMSIIGGRDRIRLCPDQVIRNVRVTVARLRFILLTLVRDGAQYATATTRHVIRDVTDRVLMVRG